MKYSIFEQPWHLILTVVIQAESAIKAVVQEVDDALRFLHSKVVSMTDGI